MSKVGGHDDAEELMRIVKARTNIHGALRALQKLRAYVDNPHVLSTLLSNLTDVNWQRRSTAAMVMSNTAWLAKTTTQLLSQLQNEKHPGMSYVLNR